MPPSTHHFNIPQITAKVGEFINEWKHISGNEIQLAQSFITDLFGIFGMKPLRLGVFNLTAIPDGLIIWLTVGSLSK